MERIVDWRLDRDTGWCSNGAYVSEDVLDLLEDTGPLDGSVPLAASTLAIEWRSEPFLESLDRVQCFARSRGPVLVEGESGAGKTSFAEIVHRQGARPEEPFVVINCAALPDSLLESELFGHARGAFTGADAEKLGLLRAARRGTIFLDEIDKSSPQLQAALLHLLDRREARAVGSHAPYRVEARLVFATNRNLQQLASASQFLPDLGYRITGLAVRVPPLRERREDFDLLVALALRDLRLEERLGSLRISAHARDWLASYDWPGNVRELFGVIRAAAFLLRGGPTIGLNEVEAAAKTTGLQQHAVSLRRSSTLVERVLEFEREEILLALRVEGGHQTRAARRLGLSRRGLNKKLHRHGLLDRLETEGLREFRRRLATVPRGLEI